MACVPVRNPEVVFFHDKIKQLAFLLTITVGDASLGFGKIFVEAFGELTSYAKQSKTSASGHEYFDSNGANKFAMLVA